MSERIIMRSGEALVAGGPPFIVVEPEVVYSELDGPFGTAFRESLMRKISLFFWSDKPILTISQGMVFTSTEMGGV